MTVLMHVHNNGIFFEANGTLNKVGFIKKPDGHNEIVAVPVNDIDKPTSHVVWDVQVPILTQATQAATSDGD